MSPAEHALREYQSILPEPWTPLPIGPMTPVEREKWIRASSHNRLARKQLAVWLQDTVRVAIESYWRLPTFRDQAAWSICNLASGTGTPERLLVENVDRALRSCATALLDLANAKTVAAEMARVPPTKDVKTESVAIGHPLNEKVPPTTYHLVDEVRIEKGLVEGIARGWWNDLVCKEDFFRPMGGLLGDPKKAQVAAPKAKKDQKGPRV
jgi:hypothetical protein